MNNRGVYSPNAAKKMVEQSKGGRTRFASTIESTKRFNPRFDDKGLMPVVVTDAGLGDVLMMACMNAEALARTIETGQAHFWSRSRHCLWAKGETSGNALRVVEIRTDCDQDAIWLRVNVEGHGATCHTGQRSCFYRSVEVGDLGTDEHSLKNVGGTRLFDPREVYRSKN